MIFAIIKLALRPIPTLLVLALLALAGVAQTAQTRAVRVKNVSIERGQEGVVILEIDTQGNENAFGFSLNFDIQQLTYVSTTVGAGVPAGAQFFPNASQTGNGRLGIVVALSPGQTFSAGTHQLCSITFRASTQGNTTSTALTFGNTPIPQEIIDVNAVAIDGVIFTPGTATLTRTAATVSAASFAPGAEVAPASIAAAFGSNLATGLGIPEGELPEILLGTTVNVRDSANTERPSKLFFVASTQVNFQIPPGTAPGPATITIRSGDGSISTGTIQIADVGPGIFAANANGTGVASAQSLLVRNGTLTYTSTAQLSGQSFIPLPINLGLETDQVFLILYGTGIRFNGGLPNVSVMIGNQTFPALYADVAPGFTGLDQINIGPLPRTMIGAGVLDVKVTVAGKTANTVTIQIQ